MKSNFLSADDWGLSPSVNEAILVLIEKQYIRTISLMANAPYLKYRLNDLLHWSQKQGLHLYMHLNLTNGQPLSQNSASLQKNGSFFSPQKLFYKLCCNQVRTEHILDEILKQKKHLDNLQVPIVGIDGHHHVHLFPHVNKLILINKHAIHFDYMRIMDDREHWPSYLLSRWVLYKNKKFLNKQMIVNKNYLLPKNLLSSDIFFKKIRNSKDKSLLSHPSVFDDFKEIGCEDSLTHLRVTEFNKILEYLP